MALDICSNTLDVGCSNNGRLWTIIRFDDVQDSGVVIAPYVICLPLCCDICYCYAHCSGGVVIDPLPFVLLIGRGCHRPLALGVETCA